MTWPRCNPGPFVLPARTLYHPSSIPRRSAQALAYHIWTTTQTSTLVYLRPWTCWHSLLFYISLYSRGCYEQSQRGLLTPVMPEEADDELAFSLVFGSFLALSTPPVCCTTILKLDTECTGRCHDKTTSKVMILKPSHSRWPSSCRNRT